MFIPEEGKQQFSNGLKLQEGRLKLSIRKSLSDYEIMQRSMFPRLVLKVLTTEGFKEKLEKYLLGTIKVLLIQLRCSESKQPDQRCSDIAPVNL